MPRLLVPYQLCCLSEGTFSSRAVLTTHTLHSSLFDSIRHSYWKWNEKPLTKKRLSFYSAKKTYSCWDILGFLWNDWSQLLWLMSQSFIYTICEVFRNVFITQHKRFRVVSKNKVSRWFCPRMYIPLKKIRRVVHGNTWIVNILLSEKYVLYL